VRVNILLIGLLLYKKKKKKLLLINSNMARASHVCDPDCPHLREDEIDYGTTLFQQIDIDGVVALNEAVSGLF
jgi:hypothetical protein